MATASIPLAKGMDLSKMEWPALLSEKLDGVPIKMTFEIHDVDNQRPVTWSVVSRSGKPVPSVNEYVSTIADWLLDNHAPATIIIVGEVTHRTLKAFKDVSGVVRRQAPQDDLIINVFDFVEDCCGRGDRFDERTAAAERLIGFTPWDWLRYLPQHPVSAQWDAEESIAEHRSTYPDAEGWVLVSAARTFKPNTRHWDYQKIVVDPTVDLRIVGFEEATAKDGASLGMVGRLNAKYVTATGDVLVIGVGPGKLTHKERVTLWNKYAGAFSDYPIPLFGIATIQYKRDPSYIALRQPTFQHWRPEKEEASYE